MFQELTGLEYLKCEIACKHDKAYEKATWNERLAHFNDIDFTNKKTFKKASDPIGLRAAYIALEDTIQGQPIGYTVSLDACSSGLQILALLVSCQKSFDLCGGISDRCVDSYVTIYDSMNLHGILTRKQVKNAIMTSLYGSTSMPEYTFGSNVELFYETMETMAPGAWDLNLGLQELWDEVKGSTYKWVMPDNFHCFIETKDKEKVSFKFLEETHTLIVKVDGRPDFHKGLGPNLIHSIDGMIVREMFRRCMFNRDRLIQVIQALDSTKQRTEKKSDAMVQTLWKRYLDTGFLSVRILEFLNENNMGHVDKLTIASLIASLPEQPFELISVHDCFRCHPNYANDLRRQYNTIMADINDSNMLEALAGDIAGKFMKVRKIGKIKRETILEGNYLIA